MRSPMAFFQPLGRALMLPIAVLPIAGLLLRLGQDDISALLGLNLSFLGAAGAAIFDNLGLLFAVGVATGFARDGNGAAAMAGIVCYLVSTKGAEGLIAVPPAIGAGLPEGAAKSVVAAWRTAAIHRFDVPLGIVAGLVGGGFYNRFADFRLPDYLAFFGGRRFAPIVSGFAGLLIAALLGIAYAPVSAGVDALGTGVVAAGGWGLFAFGLLNRVLIVTGLHHILNNVAYFVVGDYHGTTGDLRRFFAGDPTAGAFMSGFFPVMMFGLPAACLAMYHEAQPARRKAVGGLLLSLALTSFLTGVTEPIEFSFMFLAPALYAVHAVLTGVSHVVMNALGVKLGYGFSAGLFDYALNYGKATRPLLLLPVGAGYALLYYAVFRFAIRRWNLPTPGRGPGEVAAGAATPAGTRGAAFVAALGGAANLRAIAACTTRLRLVVVDQARIDEAALRALGAIGILKPSREAVQVVVGPVADAVAMEMRAAADRTDAPAALPPTAAAPVGDLPDALAALVGGAGNVVAATRRHGRWRIVLHRPIAIDDDALDRAGARAATSLRDAEGRPVIHVLTPEPEHPTP
ncbi:PTS N-acetyl-D-glucosamine transporter [Sphingomonas sp. Leaf412]|uniref:N-acetylglucosamine-specific PTS transporter subunit IIBC n=1 Tax=Sphingomonas sp. Leaf412 TaxID=1736370 RepID=UPI0006F4EEB2|nr:N-acetylglucosamine-specific PTS transporter subunit IIBC [Sphingomonas sp. Leaf412]KQT34638.1 PTS N-acetyl-D-glucosamine transporter [Sphingomonas sp. Leaf412]